VGEEGRQHIHRKKREKSRCPPAGTSNRKKKKRRICGGPSKKDLLRRKKTQLPQGRIQARLGKEKKDSIRASTDWSAGHKGGKVFGLVLAAGEKVLLVSVRALSGGGVGDFHLTHKGERRKREHRGCSLPSKCASFLFSVSRLVNGRKERGDKKKLEIIALREKRKGGRRSLRIRTNRVRGRRSIHPPGQKRKRVRAQRKREGRMERLFRASDFHVR